MTCICNSVLFIRSVVSNTSRPHGLQPTKLFCSWTSPGKNTGVGNHSLLQGIFPTQRLSLGLLQCRQILYCLSQQNDLDNHDGVVTHLESDILEYEAKWSLESITVNKASGGDGILAELFKIIKLDTVKVLHSKCQQIWQTQQWPQDQKRPAFIPIPKKGNAKECSNYYTVAFISHASKVTFKILEARLQQYANRELSDVQARFRKDRRTRSQIVSIHYIVEKAREFQKNILFQLLDYTKSFDCVDYNKLWKTLKEMRIPDYLACLLRNFYAGQEATARTRHGTMGWFRIGKGVHQGVYYHTVYLTYMKITTCKMPGQMNHKLESRLRGEISTTSDMQVIQLSWQKAKRN